MAGIEYVYPEPNIYGEECPICKEKSWDIFKCECGEVFCRHCKPENVEKSYVAGELSSIYVICPKCSKTQMFI